MFKEKTKMMGEVAIFIETILDHSGKESATGEVLSDIHHFQLSLSEYNQDPANKDSRPFLLVPSDITQQIKMSSVLKILARASDQGLYRDFVRVDKKGRETILFSHNAIGFVDSIAQEYDLKYTNLLSNGIAFNEFNFIGFHTASKKRLMAGLDDIREILSKIV